MLMREASNSTAALRSVSDSFYFVEHVSGPTHLKGHTLDLVFVEDVPVLKFSSK